jgi:hypothetical protein
MMRGVSGRRSVRPIMGLLIVPALLLLSGCFTDPATRLAFDIEGGAKRLAPLNGAKVTITHRTPSKAGECEGRYTVQLDVVGALVVWCRDATGGEVISSHSTSHHRRFVATSRTFILDKGPREPLLVELERRGGRIVITDVR